MDFGDSKVTEPAKFVYIDVVLAGFDDEADVASLALGVEGLGFWEGGGVDSVHGIEAAFDEPFLVVAAVAGPGTAKNEEFDFVGGVADLFESGNTGSGLGVGVEVVAFGALGAGFVVEVAFGHAHVGGAEDAFAGAGVGFGEDGDDGDSGLAAGWFHLQVGADGGGEGHEPLLAEGW